MVRDYSIAYASRMTAVAEKKYGVTEFEVAALIYTLEHFEVYLLGNQTTVYTMHKFSHICHILRNNRRVHWQGGTSGWSAFCQCSD